jgi:hypothetical protein
MEVSSICEDKISCIKIRGLIKKKGASVNAPFLDSADQIIEHRGTEQFGTIFCNYAGNRPLHMV